ncbi:MAG: helix-turn-helix domain-containing protein [Chloroflexi bacterium]|nr:helix-turn-helix domain-containing protein [Chloroflexota bacterium]
MESEFNEPKPDLLPELYRYLDKGCELAESCLRCPFPVCIYEQPRGKRSWLKRQRNKEIASLFKEGKRIKEIAKSLGVSRRTVQRALKNHSANSPKSSLSQRTEGV